MVNEINKPPTSAAENENAILAERLVASNRNLQDMQAEHRQLMLEMESLRQRAEELSQLTAQQQQQVQPQELQQGQEEQQEQEQQQEQEEEQSRTNDAVAAAPATAATDSTPTTAIVTVEAEEEDDPDAAEYIRAKLAEVAALKAQYARVQHMIETTNMIEQHLTAAKEKESDSTTAPPTQAANVKVSPAAAKVDTVQASDVSSSAQVDACPPVNTTAAGDGDNNVNEELLSTMLNMFTDFTSELRTEADSLRAERDRLRALKEEIMRHKRSS